MLYQINGYFEDPWDNAVTPKPEYVNISDGTWIEVLTLRKMYTLRFIQRYARHYSDRSVLDAYHDKCLVDNLIALFIGEQEKMLDSQSQCIRFCEDRFGYKIPALHGFLKPNQRSTQEQLDAINFMI